jgi:hypothetical protein
VVGWYQTPATKGPEHGFIYSHGTYTLLDFPGAVSTVPLSINDKRQITGYYQTSTLQAGFVYSNGQYTSIDPPAGVGPGVSINNSGQVVGPWGNNSFLATDPPSPTNAVGNHLAHEVSDIDGADLSPIWASSPIHMSEKYAGTGWVRMRPARWAMR